MIQALESSWTLSDPVCLWCLLFHCAGEGGGAGEGKARFRKGREIRNHTDFIVVG